MSRSSLIDKLEKDPRYAGQLAAAREPQAKKPSKYKAEPVVVDGERFDSKLEYRVFQRLVAEHGAYSVLRQVTLRAGKNTMRPDFLVIHERYEDGSFRASLHDAKGMVTRDWQARAHHLEHAHGLRVITEKY